MLSQGHHHGGNDTPIFSSSENVNTTDSFLGVLMGLSMAKTSLQDPICRTWAFLANTDSTPPTNPPDMV
jgi:hypothetical protein